MLCRTPDLGYSEASILRQLRLALRVHGLLNMDPLTTAAASGVQARMDSLDMLANNLANGSTSGFKVDREFYSTYFSSSADAFDPAVGDSPVVEKRWTDFAQGSLASTGNATDFALSGSGFFSVNGPNGTAYTRNGNFRVSAQGTLVTAEGYPVRQVGGAPVQLQGSDPIEVSLQGEVSQGGQALGQLEVVDFANPNQLTKIAGSYFQNSDPQAPRPAAATNVQVVQGKLEASNASPAESATRMVTLLRNFEMLQHAIKVGTDMNKSATEEVARVTS
jgi:flagellar basal-body rod protein FlgG